jgi:glutamyl-Q tRNA(Asp) synthetase
MIVTRFAPSPTGYLHLGHAFSAVTAFKAAAGGRFLLRIEDLDTGRSREEFVGAIFDDLRWLGLRWEEPVMRQSARFPAYRAALERIEMHGLLYPCFCTRAEIAAEIARATEAPHGPDGALYPGTCRELDQSRRQTLLDSGAPYALRLDAHRAAMQIPKLRFAELGVETNSKHRDIEVDPLLFGDVVLARKDVPASYHLAVVVDDSEQGVTLVTRGRDLFPATHIQRVLQQLLGLPVPLYSHHRLVTDEAGRKLSKRDGATSLRALRANGVAPEYLHAEHFQAH